MYKWGTQVAVAALALGGWVAEAITQKDIVFAVNCGGGPMFDSNGIRYVADQNPATPGQAVDAGRITIKGVPAGDMPLYQTERHHDDDFQYTYELKKDGDYVVVLKFSENFYSEAGKNVFDLQVNGFDVEQNIDIFKAAGAKNTAFDVAIPFKIQHEASILNVGGHLKQYPGTIRVTMLKKGADMPKLNAFYVAKGTIESLNIKFPESYKPWVPTDALFGKDDDYVDFDPQKGSGEVSFQVPNDVAEESSEGAKEEAKPKKEKKQKKAKKAPREAPQPEPEPVEDGAISGPILYAGLSLVGALALAAVYAVLKPAKSTKVHPAVRAAQEQAKKKD